MNKGQDNLVVYYGRVRRSSSVLFFRIRSGTMGENQWYAFLRHVVWTLSASTTYVNTHRTL